MMNDDDDLKEGLKKSMSEPKRKPLTVRVFNPPREDDDTPEREEELKRQRALKDHRG